MTVPMSVGVRPAVPPATQTLNQHPTFETLLTPVLGIAYRAALHLTRDRSDAEDVVQEAALLAFRAFATFEPGTNFKAWFLRIVTNEFLSRCRKARQSAGTVSLDGSCEPSVEDETYAGVIDARGFNPGQACLSNLQTDQITAAIQALPFEYRTVATLYFVEELSYEEMASILGCPIGTVRSRLHRGRKLLQHALRQLAEDNGIGRNCDE